MISAVEIGYMRNYSPEHLAVLAGTVVAVLVLVPLARRTERWVAPTGWALLVLSLFWMVYWWLPGNWDVQQSLPFHLSDWLRIIMGIAFITRRGWPVLMTYFWGLTLNLQALLTPDLVYFKIPWLEFGMYWFLHCAAFVVPIVLVWGLGYRPTWKGYVVGFVSTVVWASVAMSVNSVLGTNYGFVSRTPGQASLLDLLGPWPWYVVSAGAILAVVFALMTWAWTTRRAGENSAPVGGGLIRRRILGR